MKQLKKGTIKRIHVNKHIIAQNLRHGRADAPITVQTSKGPFRAMRVDVHGPGAMIYSPDKPLSCGARLWFETRAEVIIT